MSTDAADFEVSMAMAPPPAAAAASSSSAAAASSSAAPPAEAASSSSYSLADVERVQELIEQGMERYLSFAEIESELHARHRIDPAITRVQLGLDLGEREVALHPLLDELLHALDVGERVRGAGGRLGGRRGRR